MSKQYRWFHLIKENFGSGYYEAQFTIPDYYLRIMLFFYPLFFTENTVLLIFSEKTFLYYVLTLATSILYIYLLQKKPILYNFHFRPADVILLLSAIMLVAQAVLKIFQNDLSFEKEVFLWCLIVTYFLLRSFNGVQICYLNLILLSAVPVLLEGLMYMLTGIDSVLGVSIMLRQPEAASSFFLLTACTASVLYSVEKDKKWGIFYLIMSVVGYLSLFLQGDMTAICLAGLFLLFIPVLWTPTVLLIKKDLTLCFLYLFCLSSIPLFQYAKGAQLSWQYDLNYSIYIELFLSAAGIRICRYWEKIPKDMDPDTILMKKFQRWYKQTVAAVIVILSVCVLMGSRMAELPDKFGIKGLKIFTDSLLNSVSSNKSFFYTLLEDYGIIGCACWISLVILFMKQIRKQWNNAEEIVKIYLMLSALFLIISFFYQPQEISTPAWSIILTLALFADKNRQQVSLKER